MRHFCSWYNGVEWEILQNVENKQKKIASKFLDYTNSPTFAIPQKIEGTKTKSKERCTSLNFNQFAGCFR
jgi:hypothetical protein